MSRTTLGTYDAKECESRLYDWWQQCGYFEAGLDKTKQPFSIVIPPPNVTGVLHIGHALDYTMQDLLIRMKRMQGFDVLWLPGTDHAGIATQARVEATLLRDEGLSRKALGRDAFVERIWKWKEEYADVIRSQIRRLGASCDWTRERFTMDDGLSAAVREVFVSLYEKQLIYRGQYIINWCPRCGTALSDIEVEHEEIMGALYHISYPLTDGSGVLVVATTRPETLFGDVAIAVHPDDERYRHMVGQTVRLPFLDREIPIIADAYVDPSFGTGAVKITPAHDPNDFLVGERNHLPSINVMTKEGTLNEHAGSFAGMDRFVARKAVVGDLTEKGVLRQVEHVHAVGHCQRCHTIVEPWLSTQWFVKMQPLADPALEIVQKGDIRFVPDRFSKTYVHWLDNIHDWCISRQLWWGHRIPAWYCDDCGGITVSRSEPSLCSTCGSQHLHQDDDVLDTWFSSALWPFSTMGWPEKTDDLKRYFPTTVLITGQDIIYFWVARMIFTSLLFMGERPFRDVLIHGLVRDQQGRKLSKSLGNGIDPMEIIEVYSADALRFMLITGAAVGQDMRFYTERVESAQALVTKMWNAAKYVDRHTQVLQEIYLPQKDDLRLADRYILHRLQETIERVTQQLEAYEFPDAGKTLQEFFWNDFCDWYIELSKVSLFAEADAEVVKDVTRNVLAHVLDQSLRLMHPFMPFVTEEIWQSLPHEGQTITHAPWPVVDASWMDQQAVVDMSVVMEVIRAVRNLRHEMNVPLSRSITLIIRPEPVHTVALKDAATYITRLCNPGELVIAVDAQVPTDSVTSVVAGAEVYIPLAGIIDISGELTRLEKEVETLNFEVDRLVKKLNNDQFTKKAPPQVVEVERGKLQDYQERRVKVTEQMIRLQALSSSQGTIK